MDELREALKDNRNASALEEYNVVDCLGSGGFAKVYLAIRKLDNLKVAVKVYSKKDQKASQRRTFCLRQEAKILRTLKHQNILALLDFKETSSRIFLIVEYCNGGDLWKYVSLNNSKS